MYKFLNEQIYKYKFYVIKSILFLFSTNISNFKDIKKKIIFKSKKHKCNKKYSKTLYKAKLFKNYYLRSEKYNEYTKEYLEPEGSCYELKHVFFYSDNGIIKYRNKIILESAMNKMRLARIKNVHKKFFDNKIAPNTDLKNLTCTSIMHLPWSLSSNFHWFVDCLSRVYLLKKYFQNEITILVNQNILDYQIETLKFCIPKSWHIYKVKKNQKYLIKNFIFPSFLSRSMSGYLNKETINFFRKRIIKGYNIRLTKKKIHNIFISRNKAKKRKILNEYLLYKVLKKYNFKIIHAENLSYKDQVKLFYNARNVIAPHGAGITNILFSKKINLIEIHSDENVRPHYCLMAMAKNINYHPIYFNSEKKKNIDSNLVITNKSIFQIEKILGSIKID